MRTMSGVVGVPVDIRVWLGAYREACSEIDSPNETITVHVVIVQINSPSSLFSSAASRN